MPAVLRWVFHDPSVPETYTVPLNPNAMSSPFREKKIEVQVTTAVDGQSLLTEGNPAPKDWQWSGTLLTEAHYKALLKWSQKNVRTYITDHYGRRLTVYWRGFDPEPRRSGAYPWRHQYTVRCIVIGILDSDGTTVLEGTP